MDTYSSEHKRACEVRYVAAMDKDRRQKFYLAVAKARGEAAARELAAAVKVLLQAGAER